MKNIKVSRSAQTEHVYKTPLKYFTDIGKIKFLLKIDFRIKCHLDTDTKDLYESKKVLAANTAIPAPHTKIVLTNNPFIQCEQLLLDKIFR